MLSINIIIGLISLPVFFKHINGTRRVYISLQQASIIVRLIVMILRYLIIHYYEDGEGISGILAEKFNHWLALGDVDATIGNQGHWTKLSYMQLSILNRLFIFLEDFAYYEYYFLSLLQSVDIYKMICDPINYSDFCTSLKVAKYNLVGLFCCFLSASDNFIKLVCDIDFLDSYQINLLLGIEIFNVIKLALLKMFYSISVMKLAYLTRAALNESVRTSNRKISLYKRIFFFSLIPFFISILFTANEVFKLGEALAILLNFDCKSKMIFLREDVKMGIATSLPTIGSLIYIFGYIALFPDVRKTLFCKK